MKTCRTCRFWDIPDWVRPRRKNLRSPGSLWKDADFPCTKIQDVIDIEITQSGWDGYGFVEEVCTKIDWGCKSWESYKEEKK